MILAKIYYNMLFWCTPVFSSPYIQYVGVGGDCGVGVG